LVNRLLSGNQSTGHIPTCYASSLDITMITTASTSTVYFLSHNNEPVKQQMH